MLQLLNSVGTPRQPGPLTMAYRQKLPGPVQLQVVRLMADARKESQSYTTALDELAKKHGATCHEVDGGVEYLFSKPGKEPTPAEQKRIDEFSAEHNALLQTRIVLHHAKLPALLQLMQFTGPEFEAIEWLVV